MTNVLSIIFLSTFYVGVFLILSKLIKQFNEFNKQSEKTNQLYLEHLKLANESLKFIKYMLKNPDITQEYLRRKKEDATVNEALLLTLKQHTDNQRNNHTHVM